MSMLRRITYIGIGVLLALLVVLGVAVTFAQSDDEAADPDTQAEDEDSAELSIPGLALRGFHGGRRGHFGDDDALAEALGISVEDLQAAYEAARVAAIEQAAEEGLITEEQAEQLLEGTARFPGRFGPAFLGTVDFEELLAEALGISIEELQAARDEVRTARLEAMVEAGALTEEEADLIAAREAVQGYIDREALAEMMQQAYTDAVEQALADGAITQAQADQLLENLPAFAPFGPRGDFFGPDFHHGPGFRGSTFAPNFQAPASVDA